jgi:site-specific recombinase XerD
MLGHSDLEMTRRYVSVAEADVESQHRQFSPVDRLRSR